MLLLFVTCFLIILLIFFPFFLLDCSFKSFPGYHAFRFFVFLFLSFELHFSIIIYMIMLFLFSFVVLFQLFFFSWSSRLSCFSLFLMLSSFLNILFRYHLSYQNLIVSDNISFSFVVHFLKFFFSSKLPCTISFSSCIFLTVFCFFFIIIKGTVLFRFFFVVFFLKMFSFIIIDVIMLFFSSFVVLFPTFSFSCRPLFNFSYSWNK